MPRPKNSLSQRQITPTRERVSTTGECSLPAPEACSMPEVFTVYEASDPFHPAPFRLAVSQAREARLFADIETGRKLLRLGPVVLETREKALARTMAEALFL